jgi:hypothetical protein
MGEPDFVPPRQHIPGVFSALIVVVVRLQWRVLTPALKVVAADLIDMEGRESGNVAVGRAVALVLELPRCYHPH